MLLKHFNVYIGSPLLPPTQTKELLKGWASSINNNINNNKNNHRALSIYPVMDTNHSIIPSVLSTLIRTQP